MWVEEKRGTEGDAGETGGGERLRRKKRGR
jgi:hypothetical protein